MSSEEMVREQDPVEATIDLDAAGWTPGEPCPKCENSTIVAIVRAGVQFHDNGSWSYDETLGIYEAFCPECDWLPPIRTNR
jgi:hypothetical protein